MRSEFALRFGKALFRAFGAGGKRQQDRQDERVFHAGVLNA